MVRGRGAEQVVHRVRPGVRAAGLFALGLLLGRWIAVDAAWPCWALATVCFLASCRLHERRAALAMALAAVLAGAGWMTMTLHEPPKDRLVLQDEDRDRPLEVEGVALGRAQTGPTSREGLAAFQHRSPSARFDVDLRRIRDGSGAWRPASGVLRVWVNVGEDDLAALWRAVPARGGDLVRIAGAAMPDPPRLNPGGRDWALIAAAEGRSGGVAAPSPALIEVVRGPRSPGEWWARATDTLRARARGVYESSGDDESRGRALMRGMLLGEREWAPAEEQARFERIGAAHLLAVSGLHLTALVLVFAAILRALGAPPRWEAALAAVATLLLMGVVPAKAPIIRAGMMTLGLLAAEATGRRHDRLNLLGWTALGVLLWRPLDLWNGGFQLSFGCTAALLWLAPALRARWFGPPIDPDTLAARGRFLRRLQAGLAACVAAWAVALPIVAFHFGIVALASVPASLFAMPVAALCIAAGYVATLLAAAIPPLAGLGRLVIDGAGASLLAVVDAIDAVPLGVIRVPQLPAAFALLAAALSAWWVRRGSLRRPVGVALTLGLVVWLVVLCARTGAPDGAALRVDMLAVGDGTCVLLRSGRDAALWDAGGSRAGLGRRTIPLAVRALGAAPPAPWPLRGGGVPTVIITHPNLDHFLSLPDLVEPLGVREALVGRALLDAARDPRGSAAALLRELAARGVRIREVAAGDRIALGEATIDFLWPPRSEPGGLAANNLSLVARVAAPTADGARSILLCGDIEGPVMRALMGSGIDLGADALEAPHHGSAAAGAAGLEFVGAVDPAVVLQSTGRSRLGDERWDDAKAGRSWLITEADGALWFEARRDGSVRWGSFRGGRRRDVARVERGPEAADHAAP